MGGSAWVMTDFRRYLEKIFPAKDFGICPASAVARVFVASESLCSAVAGVCGAPRAGRNSSCAFLARSSEVVEPTRVDEVEKNEEVFVDDDDEDMPFFKAVSRSEIL